MKAVEFSHKVVVELTERRKEDAETHCLELTSELFQKKYGKNLSNVENKIRWKDKGEYFCIE